MMRIITTWSVGTGSTSKTTQGQVAAVAGGVPESNRRKSMAKKATKPKGWKAFDALARKLVQVPKKEVERRDKRRKKRGSK